MTTGLVEPLQLDFGFPCDGQQNESAEADHDGPSPRPVKIAGRFIQPSPVFNTYWRFAARRQAVYLARLGNARAPWTDDPILAGHRFTNCYRAADRVSQFLIREVQYRGSQEPRELFFRTLLFKLFNKIETWQLIDSQLGEPSWQRYDFHTYDQILTDAFRRNERLYSGAYVMPPPSLGEIRKHSNHLKLLQLLMDSGAAEQVADSKSLQEVFQTLVEFPGMGNFLAYQFAIDLNYSAMLEHSEMEFIVAGPGARDGIRKCFGRQATGIESDVIRFMSEFQEEYFCQLGVEFRPLGGRRPLQLVDCQNLFCEVDKYARVAHPDVSGISGRTRIKQKFSPTSSPPSAWFPPRWGINPN